MTRKCHNHTLQTYQRHRGEEPLSTESHMAVRRQLKQSNQMIAKLEKGNKECTIKQGTNKTHTHIENQQYILNQHQHLAPQNIFLLLLLALQMQGHLLNYRRLCLK